MRKTKSSNPLPGTDVAHQRLTCPPSIANAADYIPGPKLRAKLGISAVTLWRWRHDEETGFPPAKVINGRLYFPLGAVSAWLAQQPEGA
jgi:hypothetical protein